MIHPYIKRLVGLFLLAISLSIVSACGWFGDDEPDNGQNGDNGNNGDVIDWHDLDVREAFGDRGMVATASSYATKVGIEILEAGGNAFDAAIAIAFALSVSEPNASGLGGGGFMVGYNAETGEKFGYDYREFAPGAATLERYANDSNLSLSSANVANRNGAPATGVPMFVDGMLRVYEEQASLDLAVLLQPAINLAREGFPVPPALAEAIMSQFGKLMKSETETLKIYSADGFGPINVGETLINEDLAQVIEMIAEHGREAFYTGDVALAIVNVLQQNGSLITMSDMHRAMDSTIKAEPITGTYHEYEILSMFPPSSGGTTLIQFFNMIEHYNQTVGPISALEHNSPEYLHVIGTALQLAYGDRRAHVGDTLFVNVPIEGLISKAYAVDRWQHFDPAVGRNIPPAHYAGNPSMFEPTSSEWFDFSDEAYLNENPYGSTTHFTVIDEAGNVVSSTNTINYFFGNGLIAPGTGIILNNTMTPFSMLASNEVAQIAPYKRPLSNMSPTIVFENGEPFMAIGSPGSMRITSAIVQVFLNIVAFDMDVQTAIEQPRIFHYIGNVTGIPNPMEIEGAIGSTTIDGLRALGYDDLSVFSGTNLYFGGVHAIVRDTTTGAMHGGADPRRDGKAFGR